ncbi:hypothetical protein OnM2_063045 [Erysiphe neolycopersici]|uniref:Uncharacterized protein n=1 Tax=Erysiphe neolycopersici TaxID=212602 RepID=A0A420HNI2_9PEZI|nr:hypothetical protein OnM2_063045 [Erysiphe neolycopersici]
MAIESRDPHSNDEDLPTLVEPKRPTPCTVKAPKLGSQITLFSEFGPEEREEYNYMKDLYNKDILKHERQCEALGDFRIKLQELIQVTIMTYTHGCNSVRQMLVNLASTFAPNDENYKQKLKEKLASLQKRWTKRRNIEEWIHEWEVVYNKMSNLKLPEVEGIKPVRNFLSVVSSIDQGFADMYNMDISRGVKKDFPTIIKVFKSYIRISAIMLKAQPQHGAFPTLSGLNENGEPSIKSDSRPKNLNTKSEKFPSGNKHFHPNKVKNVNYKLETDHVFRSKVEEWRKNWKPKNDNQPTEFNHTSSSKRPVSPPVVAMAFSTRMISFTVILKKDYLLSRKIPQNSLMHQPNISDVLWAGDAVIPIIGYGTITIRVTSPKYPTGRPLKLVNVVCVPNLHTNVVSLRLLIIAGVHWETKNSILTHNDKHYADTSMFYHQWVLHFEPVSKNDSQVFVTDYAEEEVLKERVRLKNNHGNSSKASRTQVCIYDDWHIRIRHLNDAAMPKLHLHTQEQNRDAERSGGVLQIRGAELLNTFGLPDSLWKEVFPIAGYFLKRSPTVTVNDK